jgi:hypothetical protein
MSRGDSMRVPPRRRVRLVAAPLAAASVFLFASADAHADYYGPSLSEVVGLIGVAAVGAGIGVTDVYFAGYDASRAGRHALSGEGYARFEEIFGGVQTLGLGAATALSATRNDTPIGLLALSSLPLALTMHGVWIGTTKYDGFPYAMLPVAALDGALLAWDGVYIANARREDAWIGAAELFGAAPQLAFGIAQAVGGRRRDVGATMAFSALPALLVAHGFWALFGQSDSWSANAAVDRTDRVAWNVTPLAAGGARGVAISGAF